MTTFQRARSEEQREVRREAILDAAAAMLAEMPVAQLSLNELSRRVGLAKSNVLRYFESREAVLLELLDRAWQEWLGELRQERLGELRQERLGELRQERPGELRQERPGDLRQSLAVDPGPPAERGDRLAAALAASLASRPVLCDLTCAQAAVLERNVSPEVAARYKRAAIANMNVLGGLALGCVPELGDHDAFRLAAATVMAISAVWPLAQPSPAMLAAYEADPALAAMRLDFAATVREVLEVFISGLLARASR